MNDVTQILRRVERGEVLAAAQLQQILADGQYQGGNGYVSVLMDPE